jgi:hypothetical protein
MTTLDELRRANLQEQRRKAEATAAQPAATPESQAAQTPIQESRPTSPTEAPVAAAARVEAVSEASPATHLNGNGHAPAVDIAPEPPAAVAAVENRLDAPVVDEAERKARAIMDRFYRGLAHKVVHPTGVKTTVDMPPDLFWRVKRYCHDHNNVTVRQLFLDLVIAVLEEEGY